VSLKLNEVMKVLTVVGTIFLPLAFIATVYGMNFRQPEVASEWGYPAFWLVTAVIIVAMGRISGANNGACSRQRETIGKGNNCGHRRRVLGRSYSRTIFRHRKMTVPPSVCGGPGSTHCM